MSFITKSITVLFLFFWLGYASAQDAAVITQKEIKVFELTIYPNANTYPPEIADTGAQGSVLASITLDEESKISTAVVKNSSGDEVLDNLALKLLLRPIKLNFKNGQEFSRNEIKVTYLRDDLQNIWKKTCKDANVDAAYFKKINPSKSEDDLKFWNAFSGLMFISYSSQKEYVNADHKKLLSDTMAECFVNPDATVFMTYVRIAKIDIRKK